jgi:hypothetical protein
MKTRKLYFALAILFLTMSILTSLLDVIPGSSVDNPQPALALAENTEQDAPSDEAIVEHVKATEKPGDTTILLVAAIGLVLIVFFGVLWRSRE